MTLSTSVVRPPRAIDPRIKAALYIAIPILSAIAIAALVLAFLSGTNRLPSMAAPLIYASKSPVAIGSPICAGGSFTFTEEYRINDGPALVSAYSVVRSAVTGDAQPRVVAGNLRAPEDNTLTLPQDIGRTFTRTIVFSGTAGIEPGFYEWWRFGRAAGRDPSTYSVKFEIKKCP